MTKLILVRHGESEANFHRIYTGQSDIPLTECGHTQAQAAAKYISENENVDIVYASPLNRAFSTGKHIADACGAPIIKHDGLKEINAGVWEGIKFDDIEVLYPESYKKWRHDVGNSHPDGGESVAELSKRCIDAVSEIAAQNPDKTIVIATHATPIRSLVTYWSGLPSSEMAKISWCSNASITTVLYDNAKGFYDLRPDFRGHLEGIETVLPSNV